LQVVFHARIAQERAEGSWSIDDVADGIIAKLVRRHPHVFADGTAETAADVEANWHAIKAQEKGRESVTDGIPSALPALLHMGKVLARSATVDLPALSQGAAAAVALSNVTTDEEFGDLVLALVAAARERGIDAEAAARGASRRLVQRVRAAEGL